MDRLSKLARSNEPFLFVISYDKQEIFAEPLSKCHDVKVALHKKPILKNNKIERLIKYPIPFEKYKKAFDEIIDQIRAGNTYLLNLTFSTKITTPYSLKEIFDMANAPYKLYFKDKFVCFSPEPFITIKNDTIATYPMKGTIDTSIPDAKAKIMANEKEMAEHVMVVDLLRNDLSIKATNIKVKKFRYAEKVVTENKTLLHISSKIEAKLPSDWPDRFGEIMDSLLPAGSVTGTPKKRTCAIIDETETHKRGFFTGIFGIYDNKKVQSAVMIRFIEKNGGGLIYKSGGGITIDSDAKSEYQEMIDKVYLPI